MGRQLLRIGLFRFEKKVENRSPLVGITNPGHLGPHRHMGPHVGHLGPQTLGHLGPQKTYGPPRKRQMGPLKSYVTWVTLRKWVTLSRVAVNRGGDCVSVG